MPVLPDDARRQINLRLDDEMLRRVEAKRMEIGHAGVPIPSKSDILRMALDAFLPSAKKAGPRARKPR